MTRRERLSFLLAELLSEKAEYAYVSLPDGEEEQALLLRSLMNVREPSEPSAAFLAVQDEELSWQREAKGVVEANSLGGIPYSSRVSLWQGDITRLKADCIVNAANSSMLGCFVPLHSCIDNAIHSAAGVQMRLECNDIMLRLGRKADTGEVIMTRGYNLPARYVLHTVGPIVPEGAHTTVQQRGELALCYANCLAKAGSMGFESIVFCCISTGVFRYPNAKAAKIAVESVMKYFGKHPKSSVKKVVFNVFKDEDLHIYKKLLGYDAQ